jgi:4-amino-4-deoxy-L-arabinose transferase-like glycosyltransferase
METFPASERSPDARRAAALRTFVYALTLACLSAVLVFWELGDDALTATKRSTRWSCRTLLKSGDWLYLSPYPPTPYLQKPPLYFWLTASTYDLLGGEELACRAWSAAAGVGAVVLTCVLGAAMFSPEVGGLAGLLLMLNARSSSCTARDRGRSTRW